MESFWIYIVTNYSRSVLYIGVTNNLARRWWEHKNELHDGFTKKFHCHYLVYFEEFKWIEDAIRREKQLKGWTRIKKEQLIKRMNPSFEDLAVSLGWIHYKNSQI